MVAAALKRDIADLVLLDQLWLRDGHLTQTGWFCVCGRLPIGLFARVDGGDDTDWAVP
jgi:hypothetical protein